MPFSGGDRISRLYIGAAEYILSALTLCLVAAGAATGQPATAILERIEQADVDWNAADVDASRVPVPWGLAPARTIPTVSRRVCLNVGTHVLTFDADLLPDGRWLGLVDLRSGSDSVLPGEVLLSSTNPDDPRSLWHAINVAEPVCYDLIVFHGRARLYRLRVVW